MLDPRHCQMIFFQCHKWPQIKMYTMFDSVYRLSELQWYKTCFVPNVIPRYIRSTLEDSPILPFFFRFSLLMLCICCKVRDLHMSRCVTITKYKQQQRSCIFVQTRTQHKKRVPTVAEKCRRCYSLFSQV